MDTTDWFHIVGWLGAGSLGLGFICAVISVFLSWQVAGEQKTEATRIATELAVQQERAAKAEKELLELREQLAPRRLTENQKRNLRTILDTSVQGIVKIRVISNDSETMDFGNDFAELLKKLGWNVTQDASVSSGPRVNKGLWLIAHKENDENVLVLLNALKAADIPFQTDVVDWCPPNSAMLVIGIKP